MELIARTMIIYFASIFVHVIMSKMGKSVLNAQLLYPIMIASVPFLLTFVPILGMNKLMNTGMQPIFSTLLLFGISYLIQMGLNEIKSSDGNDYVTTLLKNKPVNMNFAEIDGSFFILLTITMFIELLAQYATLQMNNKSKANIIVKGMETFYKKYKIKPF